MVYPRSTFPNFKIRVFTQAQKPSAHQAAGATLLDIPARFRQKRSLKDAQKLNTVTSLSFQELKHPDSASQLGAAHETHNEGTKA